MDTQSAGGLAEEARLGLRAAAWTPEAGPQRSFRATLCFSPEAEVLAGHFPGHPVIPAVYLIEALQAAAAQLEPALGELLGLRQAKFLRQVLPGAEVEVRGRLEVTPEGFEIEAELDLSEGRAALLSLRCSRRS